MMSQNLEEIIETAFEDRANDHRRYGGRDRDAVESVLDGLDQGKLRVVERIPGEAGPRPGAPINGSRRPSCSRSG